MAVSREIIDKIINNADIVGIISSYIPLEKKGSGYIGVCPFHNDSSPSLSVSPTKRVFKCFSCGTAGNVVGFVQKFKHISYFEALKEVGQTVGIDIDDGEIDEEQQQINKLYKIMEEASAFYNFYLFNAKEGVEAVKYLHDRQISDDVIKRFGIGLAPEQSDLLFKNLESNHMPVDIIQTGLIKENNGYYDTFRNRIMFPIKNLRGNTVAFSGRIFNKEKDKNNPKYINSSESIIFKKSQVLYNYYEAMNHIKNLDACYIYEGFMDVIASYRAGIHNCVATMGTALTIDHIRAIKKLTNNVILCFDGDEAGINATKKAIKTLIPAHINVKVVTLPEGIDPDEYINANGVEQFNKYFLENTNNCIDYLYNLEKRSLIIEDAGSIEKFKVNLFSYMHYFNSNTLSEIIFKKMSIDLGVSVDAIKSDFSSIPGIEAPIMTNQPSNDFGNYNPGYVELAGEPKKSEDVSLSTNKKLKRSVKAELSLIKLAFQEKERCQQIEKKLNSKFVDRAQNHVFRAIYEYYESNDVMELDRLKALIGNEDDINVLMKILESSITPAVSTIDDLVSIVLNAQDEKLALEQYTPQRVKTNDDLEKVVKCKRKNTKIVYNKK